MSDSGKRKRSRTYYSGGRPAKRKRHGLEDLKPGMQGVLITTGDQEKLCVSEAYNLLNEYADQLYGPEASPPEAEGSGGSGQEEEGDIEAAVAREVARLKGSGEQPRRFQACNSGAKHVVWIQCREPVVPCQLVHCMLSDLLKSGVRKSRFCQRVVPVTTVCHATLEDIQKQASSLLDPHFHVDDLQVVKFAVNYKCRNNSALKRDDVIKLLACMVTKNGDFAHTVDLNNPELTVIVEVVKNLCCLSVVTDFHNLKKYNIQSVMEASSQEASEQSLQKPSQQTCDDTVHTVTVKPTHIEIEDTSDSDPVHVIQCSKTSCQDNSKNTTVQDT